MAARQPDDLHSQVVSWLKIILPLVALAILATLFLFSRRIGGEGELPYAEVDLKDMASAQQLTAPEYSGLTEDGAAVTVRARTAKPALDGQEAAVDQVAAQYLAQDGVTIELRAEQGRMAVDMSTLTLEKGVEMTTSTGYRLTAADLRAELARTAVQTDNPVHGEAPFGTIESGAMSLAPDATAPEAHVLMFTKGVRMIYQPGH